MLASQKQKGIIMSKVYFKADDSIVELMEEIKNKYHKDLKDCGAKIGIIMIADPGKHALMFRGSPAAATVHVVSLRDRITKQYDAEITIDAETWKNLKDISKRALLDHELSHIVVKKVKVKKSNKRRDEEDEDTEEALEEHEQQNMEIAYDDIGRPKLGIRKADYDTSDGFLSIIERYGIEALEYKNFKNLSKMIESSLREQENKIEDHV